MNLMSTSDDEPAFVAAVRALLARVDLATLDWKQYDLGVLRAKLGNELRIHIWHPSLRTLATPVARYGGVHDHRFDVTSAVVCGAITDVRYEAHPARANEAEVPDRAHGTNVEVDGFVKAWQIWPSLGKVNPLNLHAVTEVGRCTVQAGRSYTVPRRLFHTSFVEDFAVTVVHRSNFDEHPYATILGEGTEGTVPNTPTQVVAQLLHRARHAILHAEQE